jgi:hypothetical protein
VSERSIAQLLGAGEEAWIEAAFRTGDFAHARALVAEAQEQAARAGDEDLEAAASDRLGMVQHYVNITRLMSGLELEAARSTARRSSSVMR